MPKPTFHGKICDREGHGTLRFSDGNRCVACRKESGRRSYEKITDDEKQKRLERSRAWNKAHTKEKTKKTQKWRAENPELNRQKARDYYLRNRDRLLARCREYYYKNKDVVLQRHRPNIHARRATGTIDRTVVPRLKILQRGKCTACRSPLVSFHIDHILAISKGGDNAFNNLQLLCKTCNLRKAAKDAVDFMRENGYLL